MNRYQILEWLLNNVLPWYAIFGAVVALCYQSPRVALVDVAFGLLARSMELVEYHDD